MGLKLEIKQTQKLSDRLIKMFFYAGLGTAVAYLAISLILFVKDPTSWFYGTRFHLFFTFYAPHVFDVTYYSLFYIILWKFRKDLGYRAVIAFVFIWSFDETMQIAINVLKIPQYLAMGSSAYLLGEATLGATACLFYVLMRSMNVRINLLDKTLLTVFFIYALWSVADVMYGQLYDLPAVLSYHAVYLSVMYRLVKVK